MRHSAPTVSSQAAPTFWRCLPAQEPSSLHLSSLGEHRETGLRKIIKQANETSVYLIAHLCKKNIKKHLHVSGDNAKSFGIDKGTHILMQMKTLNGLYITLDKMHNLIITKEITSLSRNRYSFPKEWFTFRIFSARKYIILNVDA